MSDKHENRPLDENRPVPNRPLDEEEVEAHKFRADKPVGDKAQADEDDDVEAHSLINPKPINAPLQ
jgi:hypothetical protein